MADDDTSSPIDRLLQQEIASIESHRAFVRRQQTDGFEELDRAWKVVIAAAHELKPRVSRHERLRYFNIARDGSSLTISFDGASQRPADARDFSLSRTHPGGRHDTTRVIWCLESHRDETRFHTAEDAVRAMVRFCAVNMTAR